MELKLQKHWIGWVLSAAALALIIPSIGFSGTPRVDRYDFAINTNWADNTVSIINIRTGEEKVRINVGAKPYDVRTDEHGRFAYVSLSGANQISVIDLQANLEAERITVGESPRDFVMTKDFSKFVVANSGSNSISVVDVKNKRELFQIPVGLVPYGVGLAEDDHTAVVSNWGEGTISFVDLDARREIKRVSVGHLPYTVAILADTNVAYATVFGDDKVIVLDIKARSVLNEIEVGKSPWGISATNKMIAVANFYSGSVSIIDVTDPRSAQGFSVRTYEFRGKKPGAHIEPSAKARKPTDEIQTAAGIDEFGVTGRAKQTVASLDGTLLFTDLAANTVNIFDLNKNEFIASIPVGHAPYGIDFLPQGIKKVTSTE